MRVNCSQIICGIDEVEESRWEKMPGQRWFFSLIAIKRIGKHWHLREERKFHNAAFNFDFHWAKTKPSVNIYLPFNGVIFMLLSVRVGQWVAAGSVSQFTWGLFLVKELGEVCWGETIFTCQTLQTLGEHRPSLLGYYQHFLKASLKFVRNVSSWFTNRQTPTDITFWLDRGKNIPFLCFSSSYGMFYFNGQHLIITWLLICNSRSFY